MATYHILFNPYAGNGNGEQEAHRLIEKRAMDRCVTRRVIAEEILADEK